MKAKFDANDVFKADTSENLQRVNEWISVWDEQLDCLEELCDKYDGLSVTLITRGNAVDGLPGGPTAELSEFYLRLQKIRV